MFLLRNVWARIRTLIFAPWNEAIICSLIYKYSIQGAVVIVQQAAQGICLAWSILYGPPSSPWVIPDNRAKSKHWTSPGVAPNHSLPISQNSKHPFSIFKVISRILNIVSQLTSNYILTNLKIINITYIFKIPLECQLPIIKNSCPFFHCKFNQHNAEKITSKFLNRKSTG